MGVIRILPEKIASQIAAGEVIERPASVVKELVDNSIDAGATRIVVEIQRGGKGLVRVGDDGSGMGRDDLLLCLERHATSKIREAAELFAIRSMGFRGEALPSMGAVSRLQITSRPAEELVGHRVRVEGGRVTSVDEVGCPAGTVVEVRDLFFNMPARRKFLRSERTELNRILDTLARTALPFTKIHFKLEEEQRTLLNLPGSSTDLSRLSTLMGRDVARTMVETSHEMGELRMKAYLGPPHLDRSRADRILIYVNRRNIRDRLVTRAVMEGYGQRLMKGRYPQVVLFLALPPSLVDINVHPAKQEVRFRQARELYQGILSAVDRALRERFHGTFEASPSPGYPAFSEGRAGPRMQSGLAEAGAGYGERTDAGKAFEELPLQEGPLLRVRPQVIGQLKDTYILCQAGDGLLLVDQHAAHERVVYETLKRSYQGAGIERQAFLIPHKLELSLAEAAVVQGKLVALQELGVELEPFGGGTFLLRCVPAVLVEARWEAFVRDLMEVLGTDEDLSHEGALDRVMTVMACHGAIRAGKRLSRQEMERLLGQLEEMDLPTNCPHGRPVLKKFTYHEIERMFKRVV